MRSLFLIVALLFAPLARAEHPITTVPGIYTSTVIADVSGALNGAVDTGMVSVEGCRFIGSMVKNTGTATTTQINVQARAFGVLLGDSLFVSMGTVAAGGAAVMFWGSVSGVTAYPSAFVDGWRVYVNAWAGQQVRILIVCYK